MSARPEPARLSVVLPVYNEEAVLPGLCAQVRDAVTTCTADWEILFVNDGSTDRSGAVLDELAAGDDRIKVVHLSRNFGHQAALTSALAHARGDAVIVMDSDLQDDPAAIPRFVAAWREGWDVVYAIRTARKEPLPKRWLFALFYRVLRAVAAVPIPLDAGNFGLVDRRVVDHVARLPERDRYYPGLRSWVGFRQTGIEVERQARYDDASRVRLAGLFRLAKAAIFSFSTVPLTIFYLIAALSFLAALFCLGFMLYHKEVTRQAIPGWATHLTTVSFFGFINALGISILGEYIVRIYDQVRGRPVYIVERTVNCETASK